MQYGQVHTHGAYSIVLNVQWPHSLMDGATLSIDKGDEKCTQPNSIPCDILPRLNTLRVIMRYRNGKRLGL